MECVQWTRRRVASATRKGVPDPGKTWRGVSGFLCQYQVSTLLIVVLPGGAKQPTGTRICYPILLLLVIGKPWWLPPLSDLLYEVHCLFIPLDRRCSANGVHLITRYTFTAFGRWTDTQQFIFISLSQLRS